MMLMCNIISKKNVEEKGGKKYACQIVYLNERSKTGLQMNVFDILGIFEDKIGIQIFCLAL